MSSIIVGHKAKNDTMKKIIWVQLVLLSIVGNTYSQNEFLPGFIILNSNDTIFGNIENEREIYSSLICVFKSADSNKIQQYLPTEIRAYYLSNNRFFKSRRMVINNVEKNIFLQVMIEGELNIYKHKDLKRVTHVYAEKKEYGLTELMPSYYKSYDKRYIQKMKPFTGLLRLLTADEPKFKDKIDALPDVFNSELVNLAKDYHEAVCKDADCKVFFYDY